MLARLWGDVHGLHGSQAVPGRAGAGPVLFGRAGCRGAAALRRDCVPTVFVSIRRPGESFEMRMPRSSQKRVGMAWLLQGCLFPSVGQLSARWRALRRPLHENRLFTLRPLTGVSGSL